MLALCLESVPMRPVRVWLPAARVVTLITGYLVHAWCHTRTELVCNARACLHRLELQARARPLLRAAHLCCICGPMHAEQLSTRARSERGHGALVGVTW